jgi:hypothetical protein
MRDPGEIQELEARIAAAKQKFTETERLRTDLIEKTDRRGFSDVATELKYRGEIEGLEDRICKGKEMLAARRVSPTGP